MTALTPEKRAEWRKECLDGNRIATKYLDGGTSVFARPIIEGNDRVIAILDALDVREFEIRTLHKRLNVPDRCACGGLNVGGVCTSCESCHYCGCPVSAPADLLGALASHAQANVAKERESERHGRMLRGVVAPCLQCGDALQKCIAQQCCSGCNHAHSGASDG